MSDYLVQFNNISKFFGKVIALKDVTMRLKKGEIMCLLGDNGAGKSTLIKTLAGVHKPDEGEIIFEDNKIVFDSPKDALDIGRKFLGRKYNGVTINYLKEDINFTDFSTKYTNICINTSCEHMLPMNSISFQNDDNVLYVLQSNDMKNIREHVNCVDSNEEFIKQASLSRTYYHGKKRLEAQNKKKYWRFMIIGRRDD